MSDDLVSMKPQFASIEEAQVYYKAQYDALGAKYGKTGYDFWLESENADGFFTDRSEDYGRIRSLYRHLGMCWYLINKAKDG